MGFRQHQRHPDGLPLYQGRDREQRQAPGWLESSQRLSTPRHQPGRGEIEAVESFRAYSDDLRIWQQRVDGTAPEDSHWYWLDVTGSSTPLALTLVFERQVTDPLASAPLLNDLDLRLYAPQSTLPVAESLSVVDNVEHVVYDTIQDGRHCVEVDPFDLSQDGAELYALAASSPTPANTLRDFRLNYVGTTNPCVPDFGDAPESSGYPTLLATNGARHRDWTKEWLGVSRAEILGELEKGTLNAHSQVDPFPSVSGESDADDSADQDGLINLDDQDYHDDGVFVPGPLVPLVPKKITVVAQTTVDDTGVGPDGRYQASDSAKRLYLNGWADWDGDGDWSDAGEKIVGTGSTTGQVAVDPETFGPDGRYTIGETFVDWNGSGRWEPGEVFVDTVGRTETVLEYTITPPATVAEEFYLRFRLDYGEDSGDVANASGNLAQYLGEARYGEVEDVRPTPYRLEIIAETGLHLTALDSIQSLGWGPSINNGGRVAFTAGMQDGRQAVFVGESQNLEERSLLADSFFYNPVGQITGLNQFFSFGDVVQLNDHDRVVWRARANDGLFSFVIRQGPTASDFKLVAKNYYLRFDNPPLTSESPFSASPIPADGLYPWVTLNNTSGNSARGVFPAILRSTDCCLNNGTPGCDDPQIQACVCAADSFCCGTAWDQVCADLATSTCDCAGCSRDILVLGTPVDPLTGAHDAACDFHLSGPAGGPCDLYPMVTDNDLTIVPGGAARRRRRYSCSATRPWGRRGTSPSPLRSPRWGSGPA